MSILKKYWINQPSTLQPFHKFHGRTGFLHQNTFYFADGKDDTISIYLGTNPSVHLSKLT